MQLTTMIMQLKSIGPQKTVEINMPWLSKYCSLAKYLHCKRSASALPFTRIIVMNISNKVESSANIGVHSEGAVWPLYC